MTFSNYLESALIKHAFGGAAMTQPTTWYAKLHLGDPGEAGTSSPATETTRKSVTWNAESGGSVTSTATVSWASYPAAETVSHISLWDNVSAGNCLGSGALASSKLMAVGDQLDLTSITVSLD